MSGELVPNKTIFLIDEVAELFRVHENTVRNMIADGRLQAIRLPGRGKAKIRIPRAALLKIMSNQAQSGQIRH